MLTPFLLFFDYSIIIVDILCSDAKFQAILTYRIDTIVNIIINIIINDYPDLLYFRINGV